MVAGDLPVTTTPASAKSATAAVEVAAVDSVQAFAELLASASTQASTESGQAVARATTGDADDATDTDEPLPDATLTAVADPALVAAIVQALDYASDTPQTSAGVADVVTATKPQWFTHTVTDASRATPTSAPIEDSNDEGLRDGKLLDALAALSADRKQTIAQPGPTKVESREYASDGKPGDSGTGIGIADGVQAKQGANADAARNTGQLHERVGTGPWRDELAAKLTWMVDRGVQTGSLRLSPEHLGPLEVRISVQSDQVSVWFGAAHADTRAALEQSMPRLRELFAAQGLSLADAGVFREPPRDNLRNQAYEASSGATQGVADIEVTPTRARSALLDAYA